ERPPTTHVHRPRFVRNRLDVSCSRSSSWALASASCCVCSSTSSSEAREASSWSPTLISEQPLFLVVLLRTRMHRHLALPGRREVMTDQPTLRERDRVRVLEGGLGDLVADLLADLVHRGDQRRGHRQGGHRLLEE